MGPASTAVSAAWATSAVGAVSIGRRRSACRDTPVPAGRQTLSSKTSRPRSARPRGPECRDGHRPEWPRRDTPPSRRRPACPRGQIDSGPRRERGARTSGVKRDFLGARVMGTPHAKAPHTTFLTVPQFPPPISIRSIRSIRSIPQSRRSNHPTITPIPIADLHSTIRPIPILNRSILNPQSSPPAPPHTSPLRSTPKKNAPASTADRGVRV